MKAVIAIGTKSRQFWSDALFLTFVVLLGAFFFVRYTCSVQRIISSNAEQDVTQVSALGSEIISANLGARLSALAGFAVALGAYPLPEEDVVRLLAVLRVSSGFESLCLTLPDGSAIRTPGGVPPIPTEVTRYGLSGTRQLAALRDASGSVKHIVLTVPVRLSRVIGTAALSAVCTIDEIAPLMTVHLFDGQASIAVIERSGVSVSGESVLDKRSDATFLDATREHIARDIEQGWSGISRFRSSDGRIHYLQYQPLRDSAWYLLLRVPADGVAAPQARVDQAGRHLLLEAAALAALTCIFVVWRERRVQRMLRRRTEELYCREERYRLALQYTPSAIWEYDFATHMATRINVSEEYADLPAGDIRQAGAGDTPSQLPPESLAAYRALFERLMYGEPSASAVLRHGPNGTRIARLSYATVFGENGRPIRAIGTAEDVTDMVETAQRYRKERSISEVLGADTLVWYNVDLTHDKVDVRRVADAPVDEYTTRSYTEHVTAGANNALREEDRRRIRIMFGRESLISQYAQGITAVHTEYQTHMTDGSVLWVELSVRLYHDDERDAVCCVLRIINIEDRKQREMRLVESAERDPLTKLYNRAATDRLFRERLAASCDGAALLFIDLDYYKSINDTLGHAGGDRALLDVAETLRAGTRDGDLIGRFAGDEFLVLLCGIPSPAAALQRAEDLLVCLRRVYPRNGTDVVLTASIGVAVAHTRGEGYERLLERADRALYRAKAQGRNTCVLAD